jgi:hypothetical protein
MAAIYHLPPIPQHHAEIKAAAGILRWAYIDPGTWR